MKTMAYVLPGLLFLIATGSCLAAEKWEEPQDTAAAANDPDLYAWRLFVALNWPADVAKRKADPNRKFGENDFVVWESWKLSSGRNDKVFLAGGVDPGPWLPGQRSNVRRLDDLERLPLQQMSRSHGEKEFDPVTSARGRNENHMNQDAYEFIRSMELYNVEGQEKLFADAQKLRDSARKKWDNEGMLLDRSKWKPKLIDFPLNAKEVKAQWREIKKEDKPRYRWNEFIDSSGNKKLYGLTALHITTKDLPNWLWATFEHIDNPKREGAAPWIVPTADSAAGPKGYPQNLGIKGTRWENYRLRGTQISFVDSMGNPTILANSQIEREFQTSSSCITCHARSTIGPKTGQSANRLSIFDNDVGPYVTGPTGPPDAGLFEKKTLADAVIGQGLYLQGDFVWSLMRAKRKTRN